MKIVVIGAGNMGRALIKGFIAKNAHIPEEIYVYDKETLKAKEVAAETGCIFSADLKEALKSCEGILVAVKPQVIKDCIKSIRDFLSDKKILISVAAGISIEKLIDYAEKSDIPVARVMPNTPALIGKGTSAVCFHGADEIMRKYVTNLFETCGTVLEVSENKMDAVTGLSGSGPAYVMMFIESLTDAGVKCGLTREEALKLACSTVSGSADMVIETKTHPAVLRERVCSPGGTTISGVHALEKGNFRATVIEGVLASAKRSEELSEG